MAESVRLSDFKGENDTEMFTAAMAFLRRNPGSTLHVGSGVYTLTSELARQTQAFVMRGVFGENPEPVMFSPSFEYTRGISFEGQRGSTVLACGATLLVDGFMEPVSLKNCADITIKGLTIDHLRKPFSMGTVAEVIPAAGTAGRVAVDFSEEYPLDEKMPCVRTCFYSGETNRFNLAAGIVERKISGRRMTLECSDIRGIAPGCEFYVCHTYHSRPAILIENARNTVLEDVTVHSQPGMGVVGHRSENIFLKGFRVIPGPGVHFSTNTDATHFTSCKGTLRFEGCTFEGHGDDAANVHTYYHSIAKKMSGSRCLLTLESPTGTHSQTPDYPDPGDTLELTVADSLTTERTYTVLSCIPNPDDFTSVVELDGELPDNFDDYFLADVTRLPRLEFVRCFVKNHFARSVLVKTRSVLIEGCTFMDADLCAVEVAAEAWWKEGVCSADVVIRGNRIIYTGAKKNNGIRGCSGIAVLVDANLPEGTPHKNILIENNIIDCPSSQHGIYIANAENVTVRGNSIRCAGGEIAVVDCRDVVISETRT
ncbi:MAG TPA: right-handed parallel beta-helix repeat-containing protein [Clostridiales bacterium]|nr:MAG: Alpha-1,3-galactosidase B precursor [Firmicutes bacterium ADurb.Bin262]HOU09432.1 right-handed parallel beta-helix repeat-containing protein [Clostridiales bacterium]HQK72272.1 right-handed parallel beta-helix repeat-containing protein [Clostridiales bacterium]